MTTRRKVVVILGICAVIGAILGAAGSAVGVNQLALGGITGGICAVVAMRVWREPSENMRCRLY